MREDARRETVMIVLHCASHVIVCLGFSRSSESCVLNTQASSWRDGSLE